MPDAQTPTIGWPDLNRTRIWDVVSVNVFASLRIPSSGCFAATFSLWEKGTPIADANTCTSPPTASAARRAVSSPAAVSATNAGFMRRPSK